MLATHFHLQHKQTVKYRLLQPVSKAAFVNNKILVWNSSNADFCAQTLANIFYATEIKKQRDGWEREGNI